MAFLENRNGKYRIKFRFEGRQVSLGLLQVPDDCDIFDFFLTGKAQEKPELFNNEYVPVNKIRTLSTPLTPDELHDHFRRTLAGGKCAVVHGWHTLRYSFCSNCAPGSNAVHMYQMVVSVEAPKLKH